MGAEHHEDYVLLEPASKENIARHAADETQGPDPNNLLIDMAGKISSKWNKKLASVLKDAFRAHISEGTAWKDLPHRSDAYWEDLAVDHITRARTAWNEAQPRMKEDGAVESLDDVEGRMIKRKEGQEKISRAATRRRNVSRL